MMYGNAYPGDDARPTSPHYRGVNEEESGQYCSRCNGLCHELTECEDRDDSTGYHSIEHLCRMCLEEVRR